MTAVALVGAGPGDPELLTLRAEGLLQLATAVVADAAVADLAAGFAPGAEVVAVPDGMPAVHQLLAAARAAGPVVRLYRGDPWLQPAYGVERAGLEAAGVDVEAVPGVAIEVAVPALAGVAVHVRRLAVTCTLGAAEALPPATDPTRTLVALAAPDPGVLTRGTAGDPDLPAALVPLDDPSAAWRGPLAAAADHAATMAGPVLLVTGAVCALPGSAAGDVGALREPAPAEHATAAGATGRATPPDEAGVR